VEYHADGKRMFLLSQGTWVKAVAPEEFVREMRTEIERMSGLYEPTY
jgi:hypothetical protein